jgi:hypothetical protein
MSDVPARSQSSVYFERYARAERQSTALGFMVYVLGGLCLVLAAALVVTVLRPKPIHYVPAMGGGGISYPGRVPASSVVSFASAWLLNWSNYAPETAEGVFKRSFLLMAPSFSARIRAGLDDELQKISREKISSVFMLSDEPKVEESAGGFQVTFSGDRSVYIGKEEMTRENVHFTVDVRRAPMTEKNPYGLVIFDVRKERVPHEI